MQNVYFRSECVDARSAINIGLQLAASRLRVPLNERQPFKPRTLSYERQGRLQCSARHRLFFRGHQSVRSLSSPNFLRPGLQILSSTHSFYRLASTLAIPKLEIDHDEDEGKDGELFSSRLSPTERKHLVGSVPDEGFNDQEPVYYMEDDEDESPHRPNGYPPNSMKIKYSGLEWLGMWLDRRYTHDRERIFQHAQKQVSRFGTTLPTILLEHLNRSANSKNAVEELNHKTPVLVKPSISEHLDHNGFIDHAMRKHDPKTPSFLDPSILQHLDRHGYSSQDLHVWSWIVISPTGDIMADRFFESLDSALKLPNFLLLEILRRPNLNPRILKKILIYCWDCLIGPSSSNWDSLLASDAQYATLEKLSRNQHQYQRRAIAFEENFFKILICRLLKHARRNWPAAVTSITRMVPVFSQQLLHYCKSEKPESYLKFHKQTCSLHNTVLQRLSLPMKIHPFRSMTYAWEAQCILLESARSVGSRQLLLNQSSYMAVAQVLVGLIKSPLEERNTILMERSWPPWRKNLDGMDLQRSPEDDKSRVTLAIAQMLEAGYEPDSVGRSLGIYGGKDVDGTPTVQTRSVARAGSLSEDEWTARIRATRDVQEAWSAFESLPEEVPYALRHYTAMFEKLIADNKRRSMVSPRYSIHGDGKEVMPPVVENLSHNERLRVRPPTVNELYDRMIRQKEGGLTPEGNCLELLLTNAPSFTRGAWYLLDSPTNLLAVDMIIGLREIGPDLNSAPEAIFVAAIHLICRQARASLLRYPQTANLDAIIQHRDKARSGRPSFQRLNCFRRLQIEYNPLLHALNLLKAWNTPSRLPWYTFWKALALKETVLSRSLINTPWNHILSWQILEASLEDFKNAGNTLDVGGFQIICLCFHKVWLAVEHYGSSGGAVDEIREKLLNGGQRVKQMFHELAMTEDGAEAAEEKYHMPRMLFEFHGTEIHSYVRVLGLLNDKEEILAVAEWMVSHKDELFRTASTTKNGFTSSSLVFTAMRSFLEVTEEGDKEKNELFIHRLRSCIERLEFVHWPEDAKVAFYRAKWAIKTAEEQPVV